MGFDQNPHGLLNFWLVTLHQEWSHRMRHVRPIGQKCHHRPILKHCRIAAAAAAKMWFTKLPPDYIPHNNFPCKWCSQHNALWLPSPLWPNLPQPHTAHMTVASIRCNYFGSTLKLVYNLTFSFCKIKRIPKHLITDACIKYWTCLNLFPCI